MTLTFFDGPLAGNQLELPTDAAVDKVLITLDGRREELIRYECDQIEDAFDTRTGHQQRCRMVLSRLPVEFDDELREAIQEANNDDG